MSFYTDSIDELIYSSTIIIFLNNHPVLDSYVINLSDSLNREIIDIHKAKSMAKEIIELINNIDCLGKVSISGGRSSVFMTGQEIHSCEIIDSSDFIKSYAGNFREL